MNDRSITMSSYAYPSTYSTTGYAQAGSKAPVSANLFHPPLATPPSIPPGSRWVGSPGDIITFDPRVDPHGARALEAARSRAAQQHGAGLRDWSDNAERHQRLLSERQAMSGLGSNQHPVSISAPTPVRLVGIWAPAPQSGKTTARNAIIGALSGRGVAVSFATPMRRIIRTLLEEMGISDQKIEAYMTIGALKEEPIPGVGKSFAELAIEVGTRFGRGFLGESTWVDIFRESVRRAHLRDDAVVVCDDVRFLNEAVVIKEMGGVMLGVARPGAEVSAKRSAAEGHLTTCDMAELLVNNRDIAGLTWAAVAAARSLGVPL